MTREEAIQAISETYPPDSTYVDIAKTGEELLKRAILDCSPWTNLPDDVLIRFAELCIKRSVDAWGRLDTRNRNGRQE